MKFSKSVFLQLPVYTVLITKLYRNFLYSLLVLAEFVHGRATSHYHAYRASLPGTWSVKYKTQESDFTLIWANLPADFRLI